MAAEEEVVLGGMGDVGVHSRPGRHVASPAGLVALVRAEESGVMPFLHCNQGDPWHVVGLQLQEDWLRSICEEVGGWDLDTGLANCQELHLEHFAELSLTHTVSEVEEFQFNTNLFVFSPFLFVWFIARVSAYLFNCPFSVLLFILRPLCLVTCT